MECLDVDKYILANTDILLRMFPHEPRFSLWSDHGNLVYRITVVHAGTSFRSFRLSGKFRSFRFRITSAADFSETRELAENAQSRLRVYQDEDAGFYAFERSARFRASDNRYGTSAEKNFHRRLD